MLLTDKKRSCR